MPPRRARTMASEPKAPPDPSAPEASRARFEEREDPTASEPKGRAGAERAEGQGPDEGGTAAPDNRRHRARAPRRRAEPQKRGGAASAGLGPYVYDVARRDRLPGAVGRADHQPARRVDRHRL